MALSLVVELKNASMGIDKRKVLEHVNFSLADAEMCYLIGKSGAGKSTFLKTLYGSLPILEGEGRIAGFDLNSLERKDIPLLRREIGMVFQEFHLFERWSVAQNLDYILKATEWKDQGERSRRVAEVLESVGLEDKSDDLVYALSYGEQQRVVIARAILNKPKLIIADEPTGNLDPESTEKVMKALYNVAISNKTALLIATHDYLLMKKYPARVFECMNSTISER